MITMQELFREWFMYKTRIAADYSTEPTKDLIFICNQATQFAETNGLDSTIVDEFKLDHEWIYEN